MTAVAVGFSAGSSSSLEGASRSSCFTCGRANARRFDGGHARMHPHPHPHSHPPHRPTTYTAQTTHADGSHTRQSKHIDCCWMACLQDVEVTVGCRRLRGRRRNQRGRCLRQRLRSGAAHLGNRPGWRRFRRRLIVGDVDGGAMQLPLPLRHLARRRQWANATHMSRPKEAIATHVRW